MWRSLLLLSYVTFASACCSTQESASLQYSTSAIAVFEGLVNGSVVLSTVSGGGTRIVGNIYGLTDGRHGFHVHMLGDLTDCANALGHYNPTFQNHGGYSQTVRHVGDLRELSSSGGVASINYIDPVVPLSGRNSIIGRMLVIHAQPDDKGLTDNPGSLEHGNSGARVNCAVIGIMNTAL